MEIKEDFLIIFNRKLVFGRGKIQTLYSLIENNYSSILFILSKSFQKSRRWSEIKENLLTKIGSIFYEEGISGEPTIEIIDKLSEFYRSRNIDLIVGIGGGSVIDTGKSLSSVLVDGGSIKDYLEGVGSKKPSGSKKTFIAIPTTAGTGSEATKNAVISRVGEDGFKKSIRHDNLVPDLAILDPELLEDLPLSSRIPSALDALSQLIESYTSLKSNIFTDTLCEKAFLLIGMSIKRYLSEESEPEDFSNMLLASYISGLSLANAGLGVIHGFASVIGGFFNIPHGIICGKLLYPSVLKNIELLEKENNLYFLSKFAKVGNLLNGEYSDSKEGIKRLIDFLELLEEYARLKNLSEYGIGKSHIEKIVLNTSQKENPVKLSNEDLFVVLEKVL